MRLLFSLCTLVGFASALIQQGRNHAAARRPIKGLTLLYSSVPSDISSSSSTLVDLKTDLVRACNKASDTSSLNKPTINEIKMLVRDLEDKAELVGEGQSSSTTGLISGEWELIHSTQDVTRSSPFFWAFAQAFPDSVDQIFGITDAIPAPIKEIGPAYQTIELNESGVTTTGKLVSRVKVATLNGIATSIMTTRADITGISGVDGLSIRIETTKPEDSTALQILGPLGTLLNDNLPAFPSGKTLEQVQPGSSTVIMRTTFCDDGLRISRNDAEYDDVFVWRRREFFGTEDL